MSRSRRRRVHSFALHAFAILLVLVGVVVTPPLHASQPPAAGPGVMAASPLSTDVRQGLASASIPLALPAARGGVQPALVLAYSAQSGLSDAGVSWGINLPSIERASLFGLPRYADPDPGKALQVGFSAGTEKCTKWGHIDRQPGQPFSKRECLEKTETPGYDGIDRFRFNGQELLAVCSLAEPTTCPTGETLPTWAAAEKWHYFRLQNDNFAKFFWSDNGRTWRVVDKSGHTSEFGDPTYANIAANAVDEDTAPNGSTKPFRWLLSRQSDAQRDGKGKPVNVIAYRWAAQPVRHQLTEIFYTPAAGNIEDEKLYAHHVTLTYEDLLKGYPADRDYFELTDAARMPRRRPGRRLQRVDVASAATVGASRKGVRSYEVEYLLRGYALAPYLHKLTQYGACGATETALPAEPSPYRVPLPPVYRVSVDKAHGCDAMPPITVTYESTSIRSAPSWSWVNTTPRGSNANPTAIDINGDGVTDVVRGPETVGVPGVAYDLQYLDLNQMPRASTFDATSIRTPKFLSQEILSTTFGTTHVDAWSPFGNASLFYASTFLPCDPTQTTCAVYESDPVFGAELVAETPGSSKRVWAWKEIDQVAYEGKSYQAASQVGDIDGDGLSDRRWVWNPPQGTCQAQIASPTRFANGKTWPSIYQKCVNGPDIAKPGTDVLRSFLGEANGDGLADLFVIRARRATAQYSYEISLTLHIGDGTGQFLGSRPAKALVNSGPGAQAYFWELPIDEPKNIYPVDVNGDGLTDLVFKTFAEPIDRNNPNKKRPRNFVVRLNMGGATFSAEMTLGKLQGVDDITDKEPIFGDFNGSGTTDLAVATDVGVAFVEMRDGIADNLVATTDNGFGLTRKFHYDTTASLDAVATTAGAPWKTHSPRVTAVVVATTDTIDGPGELPRKQRTTYTYRDPAWDGWRRGLRGFAQVNVTSPGDDADPATLTESHFHVSPCHQLPVREGSRCKPETPDNDPDDVQSGAPTWMTVRRVANGKPGELLSTTVWHSTIPVETVPTRERSARFAYVDATHTFLPVPGSKEGTTMVVVRAADLWCEGRDVCPDGLPAINAEVPVTDLRVHLRSRQLVNETTGNPETSHDDGRVIEKAGDLGPVDETITRSTHWQQVSPETNWLFRPDWTTVHAFGAKGDRPKGYDRTLEFTNDNYGNVTDVYAVLEGTIPLDRRHEDATAAFAKLPPATASADGKVHLSHADRDVYGNVTLAKSPDTGECATTAFDASYKDYAIETFAYPVAGCGGTRLSLGNVVAYHRGFGLVTATENSQGGVSTVELDAFGRPVNTYLPDPETNTTRLAVTTEYLLDAASHRTRIKTTQLLADGKTHVSVTHLDASGRAVLTLAQNGTKRDSNGEDKVTSWIASGLPTLTAKGNVFQTFEPWAWEGKYPEDHPLKQWPKTLRSETKRDPLGRVVETKAKGDALRTQVIYSPLKTEVRDAENLDGSKHTIGLTETFMDGHGRTVRHAVTGKSNGGVDSREEVIDYQATGEISRIVQSHSGGKDTIVRWFQHDSLGRNVLNAESNTSKNFTASPPADGVTFGDLRAWRYAYDAQSRLVGTSDARGCGKNIHRDARGRLLAEDYSPCLKEHEPYTAPDLTTGNGTELFNEYAYFGGLASSRDRAAFTTTDRDYGWRVTDVHRRIAEPTWPTPDDLNKRYAPWTFHTHSDFDFAGRPTRQSSGADADGLLVRNASEVSYAYAARGNVERIESSYGTLTKSPKLDVDGFLSSITFGNKNATEDETETVVMNTADALRRIESTTIARDVNATWQSVAPTQSTRQKTLAAWTYARDRVGNVTDITDGRDAAEWPDGAKPVNRHFEYDDFYRLTDATYTHATPGGDVKSQGFAPGGLPRNFLPKRVQTQHIEYGWQGNTTKTTADTGVAPSADATFLERGLGDILNGDHGVRPNQLVEAGTSATNRLRAAYDDAGNVVSLRVARTACADPAGKCSHAFAYSWDEVGNLARARRWDKAAASDFDDGAYLETDADVDLSYAYSGSTRVRKTATVSGAQRHTVDVFPSLRLKNAAWVRGDYEHTELTEQVYLGGLAHVTVLAEDVAGDMSGRRHVFFTLGDELGSASIVLDKKTGELVERSTYQAFGAPDSEYRSDRWGAFREDFRFTGKEEDAEVGLTYFGARYYHAELGRWMSADPLTVHAAGADLNPYAYVSGSPTNLIDPNGLDGCAPGADVMGPCGGGYSMQPVPPPEMSCTFFPSLCAGAGPTGTSGTSGGLTNSIAGKTRVVTPAPPPPPPPAVVPYVAPSGGVSGQPGGGSTATVPLSINWWRVIDPNGAGYAMIENAKFAANSENATLDRMASGVLAAATAWGAASFLTSLETALLRPAGLVAKTGTLEVTTAEQVLVATECFPAGTPVRGCDGEERAIETLKEGDRVLSMNMETGAVECREVVRTFARVADDVLTLRWRALDGSDAGVLHATSPHPFWVIGKGWTAARSLKAGDRAVRASGEEVRFVDAREEISSQKVFNIEVVGNHNYFVGDIAVLVHNACPGGATEQAFTFRGDTRGPDVIFNQGFTAKGTSTDVLAHAVDNTSPPSAFISTSKSAARAGEFGGNVYVVRPTNGVDVNAVLGPRSPYPAELEVVIPFRIPPSDIRAVTQPNVSILNPQWKP